MPFYERAYIRVWCNWLTRRSDKAETLLSPSSSLGSRTNSNNGANPLTRCVTGIKLNSQTWGRSSNWFRTPACHAGGCGFKSHRSRYKSLSVCVFDVDG